MVKRFAMHLQHVSLLRGHAYVMCYCGDTLGKCDRGEVSQVFTKHVQEAKLSELQAHFASR